MPENTAFGHGVLRMKLIEILGGEKADDMQLLEKVRALKDRLYGKIETGLSGLDELAEAIADADQAHLDCDKLSLRAGAFADFINKVTETLPRDHALAKEARDLLRDGLYGGSSPSPGRVSTSVLQQWLDSEEAPKDAPSVIEVVREILRLRMLLRDLQEAGYREVRSWGEAPYCD